MKVTEQGWTEFFDSVRKPLFAKGMSHRQVDGMRAIIACASEQMPIHHLAYCLATAYHETAQTMQPIKEMGGNAYFTTRYDIDGRNPAKARELGNLSPGDGARYCGRGYVQLTGKTNYVKAGKNLGTNLAANPGLAMQPDIAAKIMFIGMTEGWFTGRKLADYDGMQGGFDAKNARRIINGTDKAATIAGYYRIFLTALQRLKAELPAAPSTGPAPVDIPAPPIEPADKPAAGLWAWLAGFFK